jgi:hypothetical protein
MKTCLLPLALVLVGCAAQPEVQQPPQYSSVPYHRTALDDINDSLDEIKHQQEQDAWDAENRAYDAELNAEERANQ